MVDEVGVGLVSPAADATELATEANEIGPLRLVSAGAGAEVGAGAEAGAVEMGADSVFFCSAAAGAGAGVEALLTEMRTASESDSSSIVTTCSKSATIFFKNCRRSNT